ncbi:DUF4810 domain-containing protein [Acerihabitans sp. TG2]|uniref:DUF4810 domain-containing protein n=1 Tax=Acerihabitans sp. TG2 TaxID=3096008 RepID=UPI002B23B2F3|nr:DUF4810 domain-containing protein [Acerihabitans sp. TG2]MEA9391203.1 DUF4810 domain-containing protein [Acerihabitans sp. TG2]
MLISPKKIVICAIVVLSGCATAPKAIYNWDSYEPTVYQYYQGNKTSPDEQIAKLKASTEKSRATNKKVPPGLYAHLGLLYANTGRTDLAFQEFNTEKTLFPESAPFMDSLINQHKGAVK